MIRSKGEAGTGDVSNATTHMRRIRQEIRRLTSLPEDELYVAAKELQAPYDLVVEVAKAGKLPVTLFTAGGIATPADAAMMMQLGAEGVFVGSGIFKSGNPPSALPRSSRPPPSSTTPTSSRRSPAVSARPWSASTSTTSRSLTGSPSAAGDLQPVEDNRHDERGDGPVRPSPRSCVASLSARGGRGPDGEDRADPGTRAARAGYLPRYRDGDDAAAHVRRTGRRAGAGVRGADGR